MSSEKATVQAVAHGACGVFDVHAVLGELGQAQSGVEDDAEYRPRAPARAMP